MKATSMSRDFHVDDVCMFATDLVDKIKIVSEFNIVY